MYGMSLAERIARAERKAKLDRLVSGQWSSAGRMYLPSRSQSFDNWQQHARQQIEVSH
jgi:hypothetical protein